MEKKKIIIFFIIILQIFCICTPIYASSSKKTAIYMWEVKNIDYKTYDKMVDYLNIDKIYSYIGTAKLSEKIDSEVKLLFEFAKKKNIDIYAVYDENYENQDENEKRIKEFIQEIKEYNKTAEYKIKGLTIDSEFHTLDGYSSLSKEKQVELFGKYVNAMKNSYLVAKEANLEYVVCIPVWLNKLDDSLLEELIKNGCGYVQLMNYSKTNMVQNIKEEVTYAKKYNKRIENIAEFQIPGLHEVTENDTFYNDGLEVGMNKFKEIDDNYNYENLTFSYHYYKPVIELYKNLNLDNKKDEEPEQPKEEPKQENIQEKNNEVKQDEKKQNDIVTSKVLNNIDNTKAEGRIPQTGEQSMIILALILFGLLNCFFYIIKLKK